MKKLRIIILLTVVAISFSACEFPINYGTGPLTGLGAADGWTVESGTVSYNFV